MEEKIYVDQFKKRLIDLLVRSRQEMLPKKFEDRQIILKSVAMFLEQGRDYGEREINAAIQGWLMTVGRDMRVDVFSIRRELVDRKYLVRDKRGMCYRVWTEGYGQSLFEPEVDAVDVMAVIEEGRVEIETRKQAFLDQKEKMT
jgi:hypothetical protein